MPGQPSWIDRLPEILESLEAPGFPPFLDRPAVEVLFGVRRRQAIELLRRFGGYQVGKTFLAPREMVAGFLRHPQRWSAAAEERGRFERVRNALGDARQELDQRRIAIPTRKETLRIEFSGLPAGILLEAGKLTVDFATPAELLEKLFALAQALGNDYDTFERSWRAANHTGGPQ
jgi:hypothetical protein